MLDAEPTKQQAAFLDQAIDGLAQDRRVISVRLALFAEMVKGKPWTTATLDEVGGMAGIGVNFLEETFYSRSASPQHRRHAEAARGVLKALLPDIDSNIKGRMRSHDELLQASGYQNRPADFAELLRMLDTELRLITPTDAEADSPSAAEIGSAQPSGQCYQLTHDYLVPSLRQWLTRKQKETRRGRAELMLADRAALWAARPENRQLPSLLQWLSIRRYTHSKDWSPAECTMMRRAGHVHAMRSGIAVCICLAMLIAGRQIYGEMHAASLVARLRTASMTQVPEIIKQIGPYRRWADPQLREAQSQAAANSGEQLRIQLALLPVDPAETDPIYKRLLAAPTDEVPILRDALALHKDTVTEKLWSVVEQKSLEGTQRLRAAGALAAYAPADKRWADVRTTVANDFVATPSVYLETWVEALRPVREQLLPPLAAIFRDTGRKETGACPGNRHFGRLMPPISLTCSPSCFSMPSRGNSS